MSNLLDRASVVLTPTAYNNGEALCIKPDDGSGDFDFSRNSAATRVNAQGLVENVQILSSNLVQNGDFSEEGVQEVSNGSFSQEGSELITNGDFSNGSTGWSKSTQVTIENGVANIISNDGSFQVLVQNNITTIGKSYVLTYTIVSNNDGGLKLGNIGEINSAIGTHSFYFVATETPINIARNSGITDISIDNVSVREVGQDWVLGGSGLNTPTIGSNSVTITSVDSNSYIQQNSVLTSGKSYKISYEILSSSGSSVLKMISSLGLATIPTTVGTHTVYGTAITTTFYIERAVIGMNATITNISVKEVGQNWDFGGEAELTEQGARIYSSSGEQSYISQSALTNNRNYKFSYNITDSTQGTLKIIGAVGSPVIPVTLGSHTTYFTSNSDTLSIYRTFGATDITITNISVIEITTDTSLPRINYEGFSYQDVLGSELVVNGSFDVNGNWTNFGTPLVSEQSSTRYYTAPFSWYVNGDAFRQGIFSPNNFTLTNGKTYNVSLWVYALDGAEILSGISNTDKSVFTSHAVTQNEWTNITYSAIANATSASYISILTSSSTLEFYVDNVSVKEYLGQEVVPDSGCGSWLWESQSTNLIEYSEDFSSGNWVKDDVTILSDLSISPSGESNSSIVVVNTVASRHNFSRTIGGVNTATLSIFAKAKELSYIQIASANTTNQFANFDLSNGTIGSVGSSFSDAKIENYGNGWYRCSVVSDNQYNQAIFSLVTSSTSPWLEVWTSANNTDGLYIWGAQLEEQSYATSYIPTSGSTVTRNQDVCTNGGSLASINSTEGVLYAEIAALANSGTYRSVSLSNGTNANRVNLTYSTASNLLLGFINVNGVNTSFTFTVNPITDFVKCALKYKNNDCSLWVNGVEISNSTSQIAFPINTLTKLSFTSGSSSSNFYGKTKAVAVWKEALSDSELQSLTTI